MADFELTSSAFEADGIIPDTYACEGANVSSPLSWRHAPPETESFALICEDPDAPGGTLGLRSKSAGENALCAVEPA